MKCRMPRPHRPPPPQAPERRIVSLDQEAKQHVAFPLLASGFLVIAIPASKLNLSGVSSPNTACDAVVILIFEVTALTPFTP